MDGNLQDFLTASFLPSSLDIWAKNQQASHVTVLGCQIWMQTPQDV
jgi:hypothetical protein